MIKSTPFYSVLLIKFLDSITKPEKAGNVAHYNTIRLLFKWSCYEGCTVNCKLQ